MLAHLEPLVNPYACRPYKVMTRAPYYCVTPMTPQGLGSKIVARCVTVAYSTACLQHCQAFVSSVMYSLYY